MTTASIILYVLFFIPLFLVAFATILADQEVAAKENKIIERKEQDERKAKEQAKKEKAEVERIRTESQIWVV